MSRLALTLAVLACSTQAALAFCGGWNSPVAPGFDGASWAEKWPVLGAILVGVGLFSTFVIRRVTLLRDAPEEV